MFHITPKKASSGSITVFLSLILLIILSLIMVIIEGARVSTAKVYAERTLSTAMDSVLAGFYGPLMKEYHILGLDTGYGSRTMNEGEMTAKLTDYMSYTFSPEKGLSDNKNKLDFYDITMESLMIKNRTNLMDYRGKLFINEAVEYMKYKELGNGIEELLEKMSLLQTPKKVSILYEKKLKAEEELVTVDEGILNLMKLFDGVSTGKKGLKTNKDGTLKTESYFIKQICQGTVTKEMVGINNDNIFLALKGHYQDATLYFGNINKNLENIETIVIQLSNLAAEVSSISFLIEDKRITLEGLKNSLSGLKKEDKGYEETKEQIKACEDSISNMESQISSIQIQAGTLMQQKGTCIDDIMNNREMIFQLTTNLRPMIASAKDTIDSIIESSNMADPLIKDYEDTLEKEKEGLGDGIYSGMEEGLQELKRYQTTNKAGYDFPAMKAVLDTDLAILNSVEGSLTAGGEALNASDYSKAKECFKTARDEITKYQTAKLKLDYSTLSISKSPRDESLNAIKNLIEGGLTGLVIDPDTISSAGLSEVNLPSKIAALADAQGNASFDFTGLFNSLVMGGNNSGLGNLFGDFGDYNVSEVVKDGINAAAEHLLFQAYLQEHFYRFPMEGEDVKGRKPSALSYEQEYLLIGNASDRDNLYSIITRIVLLRTILDFTVILGDKAKWGEAKTIAITLVGFTGLPVLVTITQTLLVILLSFSEALVDTCAMLKGKKVPLLKDRISLGFYDMLFINRAFINLQAEEYPKEEAGLSYPDYLMIFLFFKSKEEVAYRSMDLIQENIRIRYEDNFTFTNCLFGFEAEAVFSIKPKFTTLSFVREYLSTDKDFKYTVRSGYSY